MSAYNVGLVSLEEGPIQIQGPTFLLKVKRDLSRLGGSQQLRDIQYCCLVIEAVTGANRSYRRIGLAQLYDGYEESLRGVEETPEAMPPDALKIFAVRWPSGVQDEVRFVTAPRTPIQCTEDNFYEQSLGLNESGIQEYVIKLI